MHELFYRRLMGRRFFVPNIGFSQRVAPPGKVLRLENDVTVPSLAPKCIGAEQVVAGLSGSAFVWFAKLVDTPFGDTNVAASAQIEVGNGILAQVCCVGDGTFAYALDAMQLWRCWPQRSICEQITVPSSLLLCLRTLAVDPDCDEVLAAGSATDVVALFDARNSPHSARTAILTPRQLARRVKRRRGVPSSHCERSSEPLRFISSQELLVGTSDGTLLLWDLRHTRGPILAHACCAGIVSVDVSPMKKIAVLRSDRRLSVCSYQEMRSGLFEWSGGCDSPAAPQRGTCRFLTERVVVCEHGQENEEGLLCYDGGEYSILPTEMQSLGAGRDGCHLAVAFERCVVTRVTRGALWLSKLQF